MSIDRTTSANRTVTCLYVAVSTGGVSCDPQFGQNRAPSGGVAAQDRHSFTVDPWHPPVRRRSPLTD